MTDEPKVIKKTKRNRPWISKWALPFTDVLLASALSAFREWWLISGSIEPPPASSHLNTFSNFWSCLMAADCDSILLCIFKRDNQEQT